METFVAELFLNKIPQPVTVKQREDGDFLLVSSGDRYSFGLVVLNRTAAKIFRLCDGKRSIGDIIDLMTSDFYSVDKTVITKDVIKSIRDLERRRLLRQLNGADK